MKFNQAFKKNITKEYNTEIILTNGETVYTKSNFTFNDIDSLATDDDHTCDRIETLCIYFNPKIIYKYELELYNDSRIYNVPFEKLFNSHIVYDIINEYKKMEVI